MRDLCKHVDIDYQKGEITIDMTAIVIATLELEGVPEEVIELVRRGDSYMMKRPISDAFGMSAEEFARSVISE